MSVPKADAILAALALAAVIIRCEATAGSPVRPLQPAVTEAHPGSTNPNGVDAKGGRADAGSVRETDADVSSLSAYRTKYAYFEPARFRDLPGWHDDEVRDAWKAFRESCKVLAKRHAWEGLCARAETVRTRDNAEIRPFFEREFSLYQIRNLDLSPAGVITGYYEPLLNGNRHHGGRYVYPVYGVPEDLLYLDVHSIAQVPNGTEILARVVGRNVVPVQSERTARGPETGVYALDLGDVRPDIRDKKLRVRIEGQRIVPYYSRAEINRTGLATAKVIAWVDDATALYSMQVQGAGRVRLPNGQIVRLAYAEQNGHPFVPPIQAARRKAGPGAEVAQVLTRGIPISLATAANESASADAAPADDALAPPLARGSKHAPLIGDSKPAPRSAAVSRDQESSPEVERVVELLLKGADAVPYAKTPQAVGGRERAGKATGTKRDRNSETGSARASTKPEAPASPTRFDSDPSYVFFRQGPENEAGPIGALGVPLTEGRSVAVDPRTTPLGFPVFVSTTRPGNVGSLNRLMLAQDTGGAVRGAVRADYFWGFGPRAASDAGRMNESGRMWLLLPKNQKIAAKAVDTATRGGQGGKSVGAGEVECLVPDPDLCVE